MKNTYLIGLLFNLILTSVYSVPWRLSALFNSGRSEKLLLSDSNEHSRFDKVKVSQFLAASNEQSRSRNLLLPRRLGPYPSILIDEINCPSRCRCWNVTVDCSNESYDHIPEIPIETLVLEFNSNWLIALTDSSLGHVRQLTNLSIASNIITIIESKTFVKMTQLQSLDLSRNPIIELVDYVFSPLVNLTALILSQIGTSNNVTRFNIRAFVNASNVRKFKYDQNFLDKIPSFEFNSNSVFPKLQSLALDFNSIAYIDPKLLIGLQSVEILTLKMNNIEELQSKTFRNMPSLLRLDLGRNRLRKIHQDAFCSQKLTSLDLSENYKIKLDRIFDCSPNVSVLLLSNCCKLDLQKISFKKLKYLTRLDLSDNGINQLPSNGTDFFGETSQLNFLSLSRNPIRKLHASFFESLTENLTNLSVANCEITVIEEKSLPHSLWSKLAFVDMSDNKYTCDCRLVWFRNWLNANALKVHFYKTHPNQYRCYSPEAEENVPFLNLTRSFDERCFSVSSDYWLVAVIFLILITSTVSATVAALHRYRWHVRYFVYINKIKKKEELQTDDRHYNYDAFVIYCHEDVRWVKDQLLPHLETHDNLRLCLHDRNWEVGADIVDNIVVSVESSRKSLLIVSNSFVISNWCYFEMTMAQTRLIREDRKNLVVILLEEIDERNISPRLRLEMSRQTYLQWTNVIAGRDLFWARLKEVLRKPSQSVTQSSPPRSEARAALLSRRQLD